MELKKSAQICKMRKHNIDLIRRFKSKKQFKINFEIFCQFFAHFEQKVAKNMFFFLWFSQKLLVLVKIWHYQFVPCEIPFLKMYTCMYFYEFLKKLCYKVKMPKRDYSPPLTFSYHS